MFVASIKLKRKNINENDRHQLIDIDIFSHIELFYVNSKSFCTCMAFVCLANTKLSVKTTNWRFIDRTPCERSAHPTNETAHTKLKFVPSWSYWHESWYWMQSWRCVHYLPLFGIEPIFFLLTDGAFCKRSIKKSENADNFIQQNWRDNSRIFCILTLT